jgi:hypothetical protein
MIVLPQTHLIIKYFPFLNHCKEKTINDLKIEVNELLINNLFTSINVFNSIYTDEHINHRYPLITPYFIKEYILNSSILHIGAKNKELDMGFLKYCSKLISVEICILQDNINTETYTYINNTNYTDIIESINVDVYYFWCGYQEDIIILDKLINIYNKKGTFFIGVPQQEDKLCEFLKSLKNFVENNNVEIDYCPILFDETSFKITNPTQFTIDNENSEWNNWKTFNNMKGVMFLIKIVHEL